MVMRWSLYLQLSCPCSRQQNGGKVGKVWFPLSELPLKNFVRNPSLQFLPIIWREVGEYGFLSRIWQKSFTILGYIYDICITWLGPVVCHRGGQSRLQGLQNQTIVGWDPGLPLTLDFFGQVRKLLWGWTVSPIK